MTAFQQLLNGIAGLLVILSFGPYILAIIRRQTKPSKATWIIWTSLSNLTAAAMYSTGALNAQIAITSLGDLIIVVLTLKYGTPGWSKLERWCLFGGALGILGWIVTHNPLLAIIIAMTVTAIGSMPTLVKTWHHPTQEDPTAYGLMVGSCIAQIAAIPAWTVEDALQPITFFLVGGSILFLIFVPLKQLFART